MTCLSNNEEANVPFSDNQQGTLETNPNRRLFFYFAILESQNGSNSFLPSLSDREANRELAQC